MDFNRTRLENWMIEEEQRQLAMLSGVNDDEEEGNFYKNSTKSCPEKWTDNAQRLARARSCSRDGVERTKHSRREWHNK